jgi:hypothetical protein
VACVAPTECGSHEKALPMNGSMWPENNTPIHKKMPDAAKILAFLRAPETLTSRWRGRAGELAELVVWQRRLAERADDLVGLEERFSVGPR